MILRHDLPLELETVTAMASGYRLPSLESSPPVNSDPPNRSNPRGAVNFEDGVLVAAHPVLEGENRRRVDPAHRKVPPARAADAPPAGVGRRPLAFYDAVGRRLAATETAS